MGGAQSRRGAPRRASAVLPRGLDLLFDVFPPAGGEGKVTEQSVGSIKVALEAPAAAGRAEHPVARAAAVADVVVVRCGGRLEGWTDLAQGDHLPVDRREERVRLDLERAAVRAQPLVRVAGEKLHVRVLDLALKLDR